MVEMADKHFGDANSLLRHEVTTDTFPSADSPLWTRGDQIELLDTIIQPFVQSEISYRLAFVLVDTFGSLPEVLATSKARLSEIEGMTPGCAAHLSALHQLLKGGATLRLLPSKPMLGSIYRVLQYCHATLAFEATEHFKVLFLNQKMRLIADETMHTGTIAHVQVYVREVLRRTIELNASTLILVHNHPSGDATPSPSDIEATKQLQVAGKLMQMAVHDHIIVGKYGTISLRQWSKTSEAGASLNWPN